MEKTEARLDFVIRPFEEKDAAIVKKLHVKVRFVAVIFCFVFFTFKKLFPVRYEDDFFESLTQKDTIALVLEEQGEIVGVSTGQLRKKATDIFNLGFSSITVFYLATFGIEASHRRKGLGKRLLKETLESVKNSSDADCMVLHVKSLNMTAYNFYIANGLKLIKLKKGHYRNLGGRSYDAWKMGLKLTDKAESYISPAPSLWDAMYEALCCPISTDLIEDEKSK